jgi:hypothetical protein
LEILFFVVQEGGGGGGTLLFTRVHTQNVLAVVLSLRNAPSITDVLAIQERITTVSPTTVSTESSFLNPVFTI